VAAYALALAIAVPMYAATGVHHLSAAPLMLAVGTVLGSTCFGILGVALGALTRNTVVSIGELIWVGIFELGILQQSLPSIGRWLPASAAKGTPRMAVDRRV
jgi:ABC-2 type transport system permease protein